MYRFGNATEDLYVRVVVRELNAYLHQSGRSWEELKRAYLALDPPIVTSRRPHIADTVRARVYDLGQGRCAYCQHLLAPLDARANPPPANLANSPRSHPSAALLSRDRKRSSPPQWHKSYLPVLDHRTPRARGGDDSIENLCYACYECNQRKSIRTAAEFASVPMDAISQLGMHPETIKRGIALELLGDLVVSAEGVALSPESDDDTYDLMTDEEREALVDWGGSGIEEMMLAHGMLPEDNSEYARWLSRELDQPDPDIDFDDE